MVRNLNNKKKIKEGFAEPFGHQKKGRTIGESGENTMGKEAQRRT